MISIKFCVVSTAGNAMNAVETGVDKNRRIGWRQETLDSSHFAICISPQCNLHFSTVCNLNFSTVQCNCFSALCAICISFLCFAICISAISSHAFSQNLNENNFLSNSAHFVSKHQQFHEVYSKTSDCEKHNLIICKLILHFSRM